MASDSNVALRTALLGALSTEFPSTAVFELRTGAPAGSGAAAGGTLLWSFTLASGWATASAGSRALASVPLTANAVATGTIGHFRLRNAASSNVVEGTVTATGGGGDLTVTNTSLTSGQSFSLTAYTYSITN